MRSAERGTQARVGPLFAATIAVLALAASTPRLAAQEPDCGERAAILVTVLDESGMIPIPGATVVLRWTDTDADRRPVRREVDLQGRLQLCAPGDARRATLWGELGDVSSRQRSVELEPGRSRDVELRLLLESSATGRLIGLVQDSRTDRPVAAVAVSLGGARWPRPTGAVSSSSAACRSGSTNSPCGASATRRSCTRSWCPRASPRTLNLAWFPTRWRWSPWWRWRRGRADWRSRVSTNVGTGANSSERAPFTPPPTSTVVARL